MWRYIIHSWEPAPKVESDDWPRILCPSDVQPEVLNRERCRILVGHSVVTIAAVRCPICDSPGPAFEVTAGDDLPVSAATELFAGIWDRFSRAVSRTYQVGSWSMVCPSAHGQTTEAPAEAYPLRE